MKLFKSALAVILTVLFAMSLTGCFTTSFVVPDESEQGGVWIVGERAAHGSDQVYHCRNIATGGTPHPVCVQSTPSAPPQ